MAYTTQDRAEVLRPLRVGEYADYGLCDPREREIGRVGRIFANDHDEPGFAEGKLSPGGRKVVQIPFAGFAPNEVEKTLVPR